MSRKRREGFDYFIDKYELSYTDSDQNETYYESRSTNEAIPGFDRFRKFNRYTGDAIGNTQYIENSINTQYYERDRNFEAANGGGTVEFSAIPGQGGLNPNRRPLGDETMLFSNVPSHQNPYVAKLLENQQVNNMEINKKIDMLNSQIDTVVQKIQNVSKEISDEIKNTSLISLNPPQPAQISQANTQSFTANVDLANVEDINKSLLPTPTIDSTPAPITEVASQPTPLAPVAQPQPEQQVAKTVETIIKDAPEISSTTTTEIKTKEINLSEDNTKALNVTETKEVSTKTKKKRKLSPLAIAGIIIWILIILGLVVVGVLIMLDIIKI